MEEPRTVSRMLEGTPCISCGDGSRGFFCGACVQGKVRELRRRRDELEERANELRAAIERRLSSAVSPSGI